MREKCRRRPAFHPGTGGHTADRPKDDGVGGGGGGGGHVDA